MKTTIARSLFQMSLLALLLGGFNAKAFVGGGPASLSLSPYKALVGFEGPGPMPTPPIPPKQ